jgi:hypothetical protein
MQVGFSAVARGGLDRVQVSLVDWGGGETMGVSSA